MKIFYKIILLFLMALSIFSINTYTFAVNDNLETGSYGSSNDLSNDHLDELKGDNDFTLSSSAGGGDSIYDSLIRIARDLKNVFFVIAGLYFLILVVKLIFTGETDEDITKFKNGILWISIGIIVMQITYSFVNILYDNGVSAGLADNFNNYIMYPLIELLETGVSFFFIAIAIYTFFRMITANGDEEKTKTGKYSIVYAMAGFIAVKGARTLVDAIYGEINNCGYGLANIIEIESSICTRDIQLSKFANMITTIINWMNSFIGIIVIILIIYTGLQVIFSVGNEEVLNKAKKSILYIILGIFLLFANYLILTFFIYPETPIV